MKNFCCTLHYFRHNKQGFLLFEVLGAIAVLMLSIGMIMHFYGNRSLVQQSLAQQLAVMNALMENFEKGDSRTLSNKSDMGIAPLAMPVNIVHAPFNPRTINSFTWLKVTVPWPDVYRHSEREFIVGYNHARVT